MRRSIAFALTIASLLLPAGCARAQPEPAAAAAAEAKPKVPALVVGTAPPASFVVEGVMRPAATVGMGFRVAADGGRQVCALYDPIDGTPLFLSDGQQTLVYDLVNTRIVRLPISRGNVRIDWHAGKDKPLSFSFGVDCKTAPEKLAESNAWFRIDRFVDDAALKPVENKGTSQSFTAERAGGNVEWLQVEPGDPTWFRFRSSNDDEDFDRLQLHATHIGQKLPEAALAFPDPRRLPAELHLADLDQQSLPTFLVLLRDGRAWMAKLALSAGPDMRRDAERLLPDADWDELRARDATFGAAYRKALAEQGVRLPAHPKADAPAAPAPTPATPSR